LTYAQAVPYRKEPRMETVEHASRSIAEQLGVNEAEIKNQSSFVMTWAGLARHRRAVMALEEEFETEIPTRKREDHHRPAGRRLHQGARQV